ncbi:MAG: ATP-binding protein [Woeseiaceae bacterium]
MKSIRFYLVIALLATIALGNFVAAIYGYRSSMQEAEKLLDTHLADTAAVLQTAGVSATGVAGESSDRLAFQIWSEDGTLLLHSANSGTRAFTVFEDGYREENFEGYRWRVLSRHDASRQRWILVGERIDMRIELADSIILRAVLPIVVSLPIIAAIVWLVVGNGLSLIKSLARELRNKRADDLTRLSTTDPPVELAPVVDAINDLLRRLNEAVVRERRFSADAAHELRTPISSLKVHLHNLHRDFPEHADALAVLDRDLSRLSHLIEQMMLLYRITPEHYLANMRTVDLYAVAQKVISDLYGGIDAKEQVISLEGSAETVTGDEASLAILLGNLITNASKYSPQGASIGVVVERTDLGVALCVQDTGPGIPLAEIGRVFDRFYRIGGDRHDSAEEGCGLGLAIVRHIADLHHANLHIENNAGGPGLAVSVTFPAGLDESLAAGGRNP